MDVGQLPVQPPPGKSWRPERCQRVALTLQGGGALGAYQAGVYQALHEAGLEPDCVAGVSIGAINAAIIAGNAPDERIGKLRRFWETVTARPDLALPVEGDDLRRNQNLWSSFLTMTLGQPGFFEPNVPPPWLAFRGAAQATSFYNSAPLRRTLREVVDFERIAAGNTRLAVGAVNVVSGNFRYFDSGEVRIEPEHVMASGALPPALPMVDVGSDPYWDGGLVSNTPLQHVLDTVDGLNTLVFQVDLFSARGMVPRDMPDVLSRQKDIQYSSRTRIVTDMYRRLHDNDLRLRKLLAKLPEAALDAEERALKERLASLPAIVVLHLIYQQRAYETQAKDYEFSARAMHEHWESGYRDTVRTLRHREWLTMPADAGIVMHDIHRIDG